MLDTILGAGADYLISIDAKTYTYYPDYGQQSAPAPYSIDGLIRDTSKPEQGKRSVSNVSYLLIKKTQVPTPKRGDRVDVGGVLKIVSHIETAGLGEHFLLTLRSNQETV